MIRASQALLLACFAIILLSHGAVTAQNTATPNFAYGPPKGWVYKPDAETLEILKQKAIKEAAAAAQTAQQDPSQQQAVPLANQGSDPTAAAASAADKRATRRNAHVTAQPMYLQARGSVGGGGRKLFM